MTETIAKVSKFCSTTFADRFDERQVVMDVLSVVVTRSLRSRSLLRVVIGEIRHHTLLQTV